MKQPLLDEIDINLFDFHHIFLCCAALFITFISQKSIAPFAVFFAQNMGLTFSEFAIGNAMADLGSAAVVLIAPILQPYPLNVTMSSCLLLSAVCTALMAIRTPFPFVQFLVLRFIFGAAASTAYTLTQSISQTFLTNDVERARASALVATSWALGGGGFVIVGVIFRYFGWWAVFVVLGVAVLPFVGMLYQIIPNRPMAGYNDDASKTYSEYLVVLMSEKRCVLLNVNMMAIGVCLGLLYTSVGMYYQSKFMFNTEQIGYVTLSVMGGEIFGCLLVVLWGHLVPSKMLCLLASFGMTIVSFAFFILEKVEPRMNGLVLSFVLIFLLAAFIEIIISRTYFLMARFAPSEDVVSVGEAGLVTVYGIGSTAGGMLLPVFWGIDGGSTVILGIMVASVCVIVAFVLIYCDKEEEEETEGFVHEEGSTQWLLQS